jgi:hypothetical protein
MAANRVKQNIRSPESAAIAGIIYSVLAVVSLLLFRTIPVGAGNIDTLSMWFGDAANRRDLIIGANTAALSAIALLWFVAVIRRRMGAREDKFFSTVFFGSAILYIAIWLVATAAIASIAVAYERFPDATIDGSSITFLIGFAESLILIIGLRVQGAFVLTTSTLILRTEMLPKWLAYFGYIMGLFMLVLPMVYRPTGTVFPIWVLIVSIALLTSKAAHHADSA